MRVTALLAPPRSPSRLTQLTRAAPVPSGSAAVVGSRRLPPIGPLRYRDPRHESQPHVVKFSGGRSSAALVLEMAAAGALSADRGDVVLFANTSAEHPRTYEFAARCCEEIERDHGLPCFWYEFCTVEDAFRGVYRRRLSYRLVTRRPVEEDPNGYRSRGETFEELLSFQGMLPNPHSRSCTAKLKLYRPTSCWRSGWGARRVRATTATIRTARSSTGRPASGDTGRIGDPTTRVPIARA